MKQSKDLIFTIIAFIITLLLVLNGQYIKSGHVIELNEPSKARFIAPRDVENKIATRRLQNEASDKIKPLYANNEEITNFITEEINDFFTIMNSERTRYNKYLSNLENYNNAENKEELEKPAFEDNKLETFLTEEESMYLLKLEKENATAFEKIVKDVFTNALSVGVTEDQKSKTDFLEEEYRKTLGDENLIKIGNKLATIFMSANFIVDEEATKIAKNSAIKDVKPVIIKKGLKIVDEAELITEEIYIILDEVGFVEKELTEKKKPIIGMVLIITAIFISSYIYLTNKFTENKNTSKEKLLFFTLYITIIALSFLLYKVSPFLSPLLLGVMLVSIFFTIDIALFYTLLTAIVSLFIAGDNINQFAYHLLSGLFVVLISKKLLQRKYLMKTMAVTIAFCVTLYTGLFLISNPSDSQDLSYSILYMTINVVISLIVCYGSVPIWESVFELVTPLKLMELANPSNELIKRLAFETPGTYHHSLIVANLAETAAFEIGADYDLARVGAYYHDIGKLKSPKYFTENQINNNPHDNLEPLQSVEIIKDHVNYGLELAKAHKLPQKLTNMIPEHHGTTLIKYFYVTAKNNANDPSEILEEDYRYTVKKPSSKEGAILMLADTAEAAVRSMIPKGKTLEEVSDFVKTLIKEKLEDGQFSECDLTIRELSIIEKSFMKVFGAMYQTRIEYPKDNTNVIEDKKNNQEVLEVKSNPKALEQSKEVNSKKETENTKNDRNK